MTKRRRLVTIVVATAAVAAHASSCGNYCGAYLCGGTPFGACDYDTAPVDVDRRAPACVDACCRAHDMCCDEADTEPCNAQMRACLHGCDPSASSCWYGMVPLSAHFLDGLFYLLEDWCCNRPCRS